MRRTHQDEEDPSPLFYLDREESVGMEGVEHEEEVDVIIMQLKRQKKQEETQRRRQGQITEADKDEDERMPERLATLSSSASRFRLCSRLWGSGSTCAMFLHSFCAELTLQ
ncbi:Hypothetical protein NocV09_01700260 [Nannochloropsis oceanica]